MKSVKHIFFDLDHTLWDFDKNSSEAIGELFDHFELHARIPSLAEFLVLYQAINLTYWDRYNRGEIDKQTVRYGRFYDLFEQYGIDDHRQFAETFADRYLELAPTKKNTFPYTHDVLNYLKPNYRLHIITNGFKEVQSVKMRSTQLEGYFDLVLCSEDVGVNKPHPLIFETALEKTGARPAESVMIGDSFEADIVGAQNAGMHVFFFNPKKDPAKPGFNQIHCLSELKQML